MKQNESKRSSFSCYSLHNNRISLNMYYIVFCGVQCVLRVWDKALFWNPSCFFHPAGGPAKGNTDKLPVSGGGFPTSFIKSTAQFIKFLDPSECCEGGWGRKEQPVKVQDLRQEKGIPSPSFTMLSQEEWSEGTPLHVSTDGKKSNLANKGHQHVLHLTNHTIRRCLYSHSKLLTGTFCS